MRTHSALVVIAALMGGSLNCAAQTAEEIAEHGVAVPVAELRSMTHAVDANGQRLVLMWIGYPSRSVVAVNVDTGQTRQIPVEPFGGDCAYVTWHSTRNLWYSHYGRHLYEFDPNTLSFTFAAEVQASTPRSSAMSLHEDSSGKIWTALFPGSDLISYDPATREVVNHGPVNEETWGQYPTHLAVDDAGWVYVAIGTSRGQVVAFNPATGERHAYIAEDKRTPIALGSPTVFRGTDGKVYASLPECDWGWHVLWEGEATAIHAQEPPVEPDPTASERGRSRTERAFPDGSNARWPDMGMKLLPVQEDDDTTRQVAFDYEADGATVAVMYAGPDGKVYGCSQHPSLMFVYEPDTEQLYFYPERGLALKSLRFQGNYVFGGEYTGGSLWLLDTNKPITLTPRSSIPGRQLSVPRAAEGAEDNPRRLGRFDPNINVPRNAFAHPDGRHIMISGVPGYGYVGGGLIIYDLETEQLTELTHEDILPWYSTISIAALPDGNLLCGTTRGGGHGSTPVHQQACIYVLDWPSKKVAWDSGPLEDIVAIVAMVEGSDGLYYGVTGGPHTLVVFDAESREIVHRADLSEHGRHLRNQALITGPDGNIYMALTKSLLRITPGSFEAEVLATPPDGISAGLAIVNDRIYFASGSRIMSVGL